MMGDVRCRLMEQWREANIGDLRQPETSQPQHSAFFWSKQTPARGVVHGVIEY